MTITEFRTRLQRAKQDIINYAPKLVDEIAVSSLSIVKRRSTEEGIYEDAVKGKYVEYSDNTYSTHYLKGKELNASGRAYTENNKTGNWAGLRKAQGLPSDRVNLAYSVRMWNSFQVIQTSNPEYGQYIAVLGAVDAESRKKILSNVKKYGMFFKPTPDESKLMAEIAAERVMNVFQDALKA